MHRHTRIQQTIAKALNNDDNDNANNNHNNILERLDAQLHKVQDSIPDTITRVQMLKNEIAQLSS